MGNKCDPHTLRIAHTGWMSKWCASKYNYGKFVSEDHQIRSTIERILDKDVIASIKIQRSDKTSRAEKTNLLVNVITNRPGAVIGKDGVNIKLIKSKLQSILPNYKIVVDIIEAYKPETNARLIASSIAKQLEQKKNYRRAVNTAIMFAMKSRLDGIKVIVSGRLNGSSIARTELFLKGSMPLASVRSNIQYWSQQANTSYGICGVSVYTHTGESNVITVS